MKKLEELQELIQDENGRLFVNPKNSEYNHRFKSYSSFLLSKPVKKAEPIGKLCVIVQIDTPFIPKRANAYLISERTDRDYDEKRNAGKFVESGFIVRALQFYRINKA
ncbi:hypothetical protein JXB27_04175 [Candidatus Woesearchaeota archaeon]|nr:hypothetical protein [Candidatus Woesearchaeota archaeon]